MTHGKGKPTINVRQTVFLKNEGHTASNLLGTAISVTPHKNGDGGIAIYKGLVAGKVRVYGADVSETIDVAQDGDTEIKLVLE